MSVNAVDFVIARPDDWDELDLLSEEAEALLGDQVATALSTGARGSSHGQILMARGLYSAAPGRRPLVLGLVATLAGPDVPASREPLDPDGFRGHEVLAVNLPVGPGLRIRHTKVTEMLGDVLQLLDVQYLIDTPSGLLMLTFTTPNAGGDEQWAQLFDRMAATARLEPATG